MAARPDKHRRLFFALWPTDAVRARLAQEAQQYAAQVACRTCAEKAGARQPAKVTPFAGGNEATVRKSAAGGFFQRTGRAIPARNLHITLVFLGAVPEQRVSEALQAAALTEGVRFSLQLDRIEFWRRSKLVCLTTASAPPALLSLVDGLRGNLVGRGFELREQAFRPHVTLVRDAARAPAPGEVVPVQWSAGEFALVESKVGQRGSEYVVLERWTLP